MPIIQNQNNSNSNFISSGQRLTAVRVKDIETTISNLLSDGVKMVSEIPTLGADGHRIAFVHPSSAGGVLIELVESNT